MTVRDMLTRSLRLIGVLASGEVASGSMITDALSSLNGMIDSMKNNGFLVYENQIVDLSLVSSQQSYTIGLTGDFNVPRPDNINKASYLLNDIEYPIEIVNEAKWADISYKALTTDIPSKLYYNPSYPLGTIQLWPAPMVNGTLRIYVPKAIDKFASPNDTVSLPPGYEDLFVYGGADRIAPEYGTELTPRQMQIFTETKAAISRQNTVPQYMECDATGANTICKADPYRIFGGS
jgi:hypothetical protein